MLNEKTKQFLEEFKFALENYYVNKEEIQRIFDRHFELIGFSKRKVEFYQNLEGWTVWIAALGTALDTARDTAWDVALAVAQDAVWDAARDAAWDAARNAAWDAAWIAARNAALDAAQDAAWTATGSAALNVAWDVARNAARDATRTAALDVALAAVWAAACINSCEKDDNCKICEFRRKFCEPMFSLLQNGVFFYWVLKDKVIVVIRPKIRHLNSRLHSETQPAIEWDNEKYYFLWGVKLDKDLWEKIVNKKLSFKEIMSLKNIEQRMVALKMMDAEKLLKDSKAKLLDKSEKGNELYLVEGVFRQPAYFLKYTCPSTGRVYVSGIDPEIAEQNPNADFCMSWKLGITLDEYLKNLIQET